MNAVVAADYLSHEDIKVHALRIFMPPDIAAELVLPTKPPDKAAEFKLPAKPPGDSTDSLS